MPTLPDGQRVSWRVVIAANLFLGAMLGGAILALVAFLRWIGLGSP